MEDFRGSSHILAISRSVLGLSALQGGPELDPNNPCKLQVVKSNLGALPEPLGFEIVPSRELPHSLII